MSRIVYYTEEKAVDLTKSAIAGYRKNIVHWIHWTNYKLMADIAMSTQCFYWTNV